MKPFHAKQGDELSIVSKILMYLVLGHSLLLLIAGISHVVFVPSFYTIYYTSITIISAFFLLYFVFDAALHDNEFQLLSFLFVSLILTARMACSFASSIIDELDQDDCGGTPCDTSFLGILKRILRVLYTDTPPMRFMLLPMIVTVLCQLVYLLLVPFVHRQIRLKRNSRVLMPNHLMENYDKKALVFKSLLLLDFQFSCVLSITSGFFITPWMYAIPTGLALFLLSAVILFIALKLFKRTLKISIVIFEFCNLILPIVTIANIVLIFVLPALTLGDHFEDIDIRFETIGTVIANFIFFVLFRVILMIWALVYCSHLRKKRTSTRAEYPDDPLAIHRSSTSYGTDGEE